MSFNLSSTSNFSSASSTILTSPGSLQLSRPFMIVYLTIRILWSLFSFAGNSLTLFAIIRFPSLREHSANFLLCSLTLADLLGALLPFPVVLHQMVLYGRDGYVVVCLVEKTLSIMATRGNVYSLFMMAFDRFIAIVYPLRYPTVVTPHRVRMVLGAIWAWVLIETPLLVGLRHRMTSHMTCKYFIFLPDIYRKYFIPQLVMFLLVTIVLYAFIARIALKQSQMIQDAAAAVVGPDVVQTHKEHKVAKMMGLVLGAYLTTYLPSVVVGIMLNRHQTILLLQIEKVVTIIFWMGIWVNPLIYAWKSRDFRRAFKIILHLRNPEDVENQVTN